MRATTKQSKVKRIAAAGVVAGALAAIGLAGAGVAGASTTPSTSAPEPTAASTCLPGGHDDMWPIWTDGRPGRDPGVTVWHDRSGWHVRVTHNSLHDRVFSGEIRTTGELVNVKAVRLERNDYLRVGPDRHVLQFKFNNYGAQDGFDFNTHCAPYLQFGFSSDGHVVPTAKISIGLKAVHPKSDPFVIARTA